MLATLNAPLGVSFSTLADLLGTQNVFTTVLVNILPVHEILEGNESRFLWHVHAKLNISRRKTEIQSTTHIASFLPWEANI